MSGDHQIYEVVAWERPHIDGEQYFFVYWTHGHTGFKYVFPNIKARDELDAYTIAIKKLDTGDH
jgi:hypothetical protein